MGRPELPVDFTVPARGELAAALRELRAAAGLTYAGLAELTGMSQATLKRAASGRIVPSYEKVSAIATACGSVPGAFYRLWLAGRVADRGRLARLRRPGAPELMTTRGALSEAMEYFYERAGAPPLRRIQERAGGAHQLAVSSAARIVNREALPASRQQCVAFLTACGLTDRQADRWATAYERVVGSSGTSAAVSSEVEAALSRDVEAVLAVLFDDERGRLTHQSKRIRNILAHQLPEPTRRAGREFVQRTLTRPAGDGQGARRPRAA
ncbi:helix-turn-helix domain-containing protein [Streptomyces vinaceus]|uniref:helix-turn-helix domain-containing protein n=1 Tax=Streptomyces vinaceus TaxID=1960 RepID=UPI0035DA3324